MEEDPKVNMALDDIIKMEHMKTESGSNLSHRSNFGSRANGVWKKFANMKRSADGDPNSIQNLRYSSNGPLAHRNRKRYFPFQRAAFKGRPMMQYGRSRVRYATQYLNRIHQGPRHMMQGQAPFSKQFVHNRLLALKRLQERRSLMMKMSARSHGSDDDLSVVIPNELAMNCQAGQRYRSGSVGRSGSQLTVRNMQRFNELCGGNGRRSRPGSVYSAGHLSRRSRSASVGRHSRNQAAGPFGRWGSRPGTPANSEASGYSVGYHSRLLNYGLQRKVAMVQGLPVPVDRDGRPVIVCNGLGVEHLVSPVGTNRTLHERISEMLQKL
ncbi:uncharacterized protein LOC134532006 [Bacillus rossius redtenbacheri]|uniref:uncharacterized protein LOC134532006 n=1 Tax=Bacillus rossius redtenbacheri TaxID=93214 RepID=UPI002FDEEECF